ncbi:hypothetical protein OG559_10805 [Micromonospora sp. NBC_01405]|uniref:hypothetical protein n=1 Tax=Micromonospora sp. NBC_01405 TaxID=2903589 RepID=UPI00324B0123
MARLAHEHSGLVLTGRSHNVAAQATTLGKRFASAAEELLIAYELISICAAGGRGVTVILEP